MIFRWPWTSSSPSATGPESNAGAGISLEAVQVHVQTHSGCLRGINEDAARSVYRRGLRDTLVACVADGMGGHHAGENASRLAVETVTEGVLAQLSSLHQSSRAPERALEDAFAAAHTRIVEEGARSDEHAGMGTTCTTLLLRETGAYVGHVGDSRLYRLRADVLRQLTNDHSLVAALVREGHLTAEDARRHADRNVITRALGGQAHQPDVYRLDTDVRGGDQYLLCTDGLYDLVPDDELQAVLVSHSSLRAGQQLIQRAVERGAPDNVTAVIVTIREERARNRRAVADTRELKLPGGETP